MYVFCTLFSSLLSLFSKLLFILDYIQKLKISHVINDISYTRRIDMDGDDLFHVLLVMENDGGVCVCVCVN